MKRKRRAPPVAASQRKCDGDRNRRPVCDSGTHQKIESEEQQCTIKGFIKIAMESHWLQAFAYLVQ